MIKKLIFILFLFSLCLYGQNNNKSKVSEKLIDYINEGNIKGGNYCE